MYVPAHFSEERLPVQHEFIRAHPFGLLVSHGSAGIEATPVPFLLDADASPLGTLATHVARANEQWHRIAEGAEDVLVVFQGVNAYVSPTFYPSRAETGRVAPTWNYLMVQAHGRARIIDDTQWLRAQVDRLTRSREGNSPAAWSVNDAPPSYVEGMLKGIVGIEIRVERMLGKWKASQNRTADDRAGVVKGLRSRDDDASHAMASIVQERMDRDFT